MLILISLFLCATQLSSCALQRFSFSFSNFLLLFVSFFGHAHNLTLTQQLLVITRQKKELCPTKNICVYGQRIFVFTFHPVAFCSHLSKKILSMNKIAFVFASLSFLLQLIFFLLFFFLILSLFLVLCSFSILS